MELQALGVQLSSESIGALIANFIIRPTIFSLIKEVQDLDEEMKQKELKVQNGENDEFQLRKDKLLLFKGRVCVPKEKSLRKAILEETHSLAYAMHLGSTKMYRNLKENYWWKRMKREIAEYASKCLTVNK